MIKIDLKTCPTVEVQCGETEYEAYLIDMFVDPDNEHRFVVMDKETMKFEQPYSIHCRYKQEDTDGNETGNPNITEENQ